MNPFLLFLSLGIPGADSGEAPSTFFRTQVQPLLKKYCVRCHSNEKHEGKVNLAGFQSLQDVKNDRATWRKALRVLVDEEMPPEDPLPTAKESQRLIQWIEGIVNRAAADPVAGHVTIPRLNRREYNNTIRDLLGVDLKPGELFSPDGQGQSGFDNDRDALFITPALMEKYLNAADRSLEAALSLGTKPVQRRFESEKMFMTETRERPQKLADGSVGYVLNRGQMTLYESLLVPCDGYYRFTVRAAAVGGPSETRLRIDDVAKADVKVAEHKPGTFTFDVLLRKGSHQMAWNVVKPLAPKVPKTRKRNPKKAYKKPPADANKIVTLQSQRNAPSFHRERASDQIQRLSKALRGNEVGLQRPYEWLRLLGTDGDPKEIARFKSYVVDRTPAVEKAKDRLADALKVKRYAFDRLYAEQNRKQLDDRKALLAAVAKIKREQSDAKPGNVAIDWINVEGPIDPKGRYDRSRILTDLPHQGLSAEEAARRVIKTFATRAFRRPVEDEEIEKYVSLFQKAHSRGDDFQRAIRLALSGILTSPHFLFRFEQGPLDQEFPLTDYQLANRLSYFLWESMPDEELFSLAEQGRLKQPDVMVQQVGRMLADPKSRSFVESFVDQWLGLAGMRPDPVKYPQFDRELDAAMRAEAVLTFESILKDNRSLLELLRHNETYLNSRLARHYGVRGVNGAELVRTPLKGPVRGGLLGMGAVLTATSNPTRTSPVIRGKWVLETLLGRTLPEPPADAGELSTDAGQRGKTLREELMLHRRNPSCAACHQKIDPIGFGLENFDALGRFRTTQQGKKIDCTATLPNGVTLDGPEALKDYLFEHKRDEFTATLTRRLLSFALGRSLQEFDEAAVTGIVNAVRDDGYRGNTLIRQVVLSHAFRHQNNRPAQTP